MTTADPGTDLAPLPVNPSALTLAAVRALGLDPNDGPTQAMVWICRHYNLSPIFGHVIVLPGKQGKPRAPYLTHDGMVQLAHNSGDLDGIEVVHQWETENGFGATVSVWSKRCTHAFTFNGGCGKGEPQARAGYGAQMAVTRATRSALRRAFPIVSALDLEDDGGDAADVRDGEYGEGPEGPDAAAIAPPPPAPASDDPPADGAGVGSRPGDQGEAHREVSTWSDDDRALFLAAWGIDDYRDRWPTDAVAAVLDGTALAGVLDPVDVPPEDEGEVAP